MGADTGRRLREMRVDGGAAASDLLMQMQADFSGLKVVRPANLETTAQGAAFMAGLSAGVWPDLAALARTWRIERTFSPRMARTESRRRRALWRRAVERARGWAVNR
jgi:glycerol kinase